MYLYQRNDLSTSKRRCYHHCECSPSSRNGDVVTNAPTIYRNVVANVPTFKLIATIDKKSSHNPNFPSSKVRSTNGFLETALWIKAEVPLAVKCFDVNSFVSTLTILTSKRKKFAMRVSTLLFETSMSLGCGRIA